MSMRSVARTRAFTIPGRVSIVIVLIFALVLLALLYRTQSNAAAVKAETAKIAKSGRGINANTDAILQLNRTNELARSILTNTQPLHGTLNNISDLSSSISSGAAHIDGNARSINGSSSSINSSAASIRDGVSAVSDTSRDINGTLGGVNKNASQILSKSQSVERGIKLIGSNLDATVGVTSQILSDAKGINSQAETTDHLSACIDHGLNGGAQC